MIYKLVSVKVVISKIVRDLGLGDSEIHEQDFIEWIGEGLSQIGAYTQFTPKECIIPVIDHVGMLPCDFVENIKVINTVATNCGGSKYDIMDKLLTALGLKQAETAPVLCPEQFHKLQFGIADRYQEVPAMLRSNQGLINATSTDLSINDMSYRFVKEGRYLQTGFREGYLTLRYLAFPLDNCGYPLIPENVSYKTALFWKVVFHLSMRGFQMPTPELNNLEYCRMQWNFYCKQARGDANMPDLEKLDQYAKMWSSLVPYYNDFDQDFRHR